MELARNEMQTAFPRIWTLVAHSVSCVDNCHKKKKKTDKKKTPQEESQFS